MLKTIGSLLNKISRQFAVRFRGNTHSREAFQEDAIVDIKHRILNDINLLYGKRELTAQDLLLDPEFSYFLLHASYGDKWCILSFVYEFLQTQKHAKIIAFNHDRELIRIFIGEELISRSVIFLDDEFINFISAVIKPNSMSSMHFFLNEARLTQTPIIISEGFPKNIMRHLHLVKYPYFSDLHLYHGLSYAICQRMILYLPCDSLPSKPISYADNDRLAADAIYNSHVSGVAAGSVLFNVYNISHVGFDAHQISLIVKRFEEYDIQVFMNLTGHPLPDQIEDILGASKMSVSVKVPGHLLALLSEKMTAVVGIIGGAMNVAVQFSKSHILTFYTNGVGYDLPLSKLFGGRYSDNIWYHYDRDWPCFFDDRVLKFVDCSDLSQISEQHINKIIDDFVGEVFQIERKII